MKAFSFGRLLAAAWTVAAAGAAIDSVDDDVVPITPRERSLQSANRLWDISEPDMAYSGMQLDLDYTVRDHVRSTYISVDLFRDKACTKPIDKETNNYLSTDIINDLSDYGDGTGTRTVTVDFNINPQTIHDSRIITFAAGAQGTIVSFCARFNLHDPEKPALTANSRDTVIVIGVDIVDKIEITGIIDDEEQKYGAEGYECDENNEEIESPTVKHQGDGIRVCVRPDAYARQFGVVMKSINAFWLQRGDVEQEIIIPNGVTKDLEKTVYRCTPGESVCYFTTIVDNAFYYSQGQVGSVGVAWLQYEYDGTRKLVKVPVGMRKAREDGGFIGARPFEVSFEVEPSGADFDAIAFECSTRNLPLTEEQRKTPKVVGDSIRICVTPSKDAREGGVYMRTIASFFFQQGESVQFAVEPTGKQAEDRSTLMLCNSGEPICAFKTVLSDKFFESEEQVTGNGEIHLQFGTDPGVPQTRRAKVVMHREVQITDAGFAGAAKVFVDFTVDPTFVPLSEDTWQAQANDWWLDTPLFLRIVYVMVMILAFLILICFLWAICCGHSLCGTRKKTVEAREGAPQDSRYFIQPIFWSPAPEEEGEDEVDFCDSLRDPEQFHFEPGEPPLEAPSDSRSIPSVPEDSQSIPTVPDEEDSVFRAANPPPESFRKLEDDQSKSPKHPSSHSSAAGGDIKSPRRQGSKKRMSSNSPRTPRKMADDDGIRVSVSKSPEPAKMANDDGIRVSVSKSPKPRSPRKMANDDGIRVSVSKSPKPRKSQVDGDGIRVSVSKSPKRHSSRVSVSGSSTKSPKTASLHSSMDGSIRSPDGSSRSVNGRSLPRRSEIKSPGGRRATLVEPSSAKRSPKKSPRSSRVSNGANAGTKMPDALPFAGEPSSAKRSPKKNPRSSRVSTSANGTQMPDALPF
jgi:hypothetical protein